MYTIYFTNFGYSPDVEFLTLEDAIAYSVEKGFDTTISKDGEYVGSWSCLNGFRSYDTHC